MKITPGENVAIVTTMPSLSGSSLIVRLSITCPIDADDVSSSGDSAFTSTVWFAWPISSATLIDTWSLTRTTMPLRVYVLKPGCSTLTVVSARDQQREHVIAGSVGQRSESNAGVDVLRFDLRADDQRVGRVGDAAEKSAASFLRREAASRTKPQTEELFSRRKLYSESFAIPPSE